MMKTGPTNWDKSVGEDLIVSREGGRSSKNGDGMTIGYKSPSNGDGYRTVPESGCWHTYSAAENCDGRSEEQKITENSGS